MLDRPLGLGPDPFARCAGRSDFSDEFGGRGIFLLTEIVLQKWNITLRAALPGRGLSLSESNPPKSKMQQYSGSVARN